jgi:putative phage-type endonuclease
MSFYMVEDIEQGTDSWLAWRRGVIGASEAAIIMGDNRFKGRQQLMDEKLGRVAPFSGNAATRLGNLHEGPAREALKKKFKQNLNPIVVQDDSDPYLAASLDAINDSKDAIFEIKCGPRTYEFVEERGRIPSHYVAQVQHMLMVTQLESLVFAVYQPNMRLITLTAHRNDSYIKELREKELRFISDLVRNGHCVQTEFRGIRVDARSVAKAPKKRIQKPLAAGWRIDSGELAFWDGKNLLVGAEPGKYELDGDVHSWNGQNWVPRKRFTYLIEGTPYKWNGKHLESIVSRI